METGVVNRPWALRLSTQSSASLAPLRLSPGLSAAVDGPALWLRGDSLDEPLRNLLLRLPADGRYTVASNGLLTLWGCLTPAGELPKLDWRPLRAWGVLSLPELGWPAEAPPGAVLTLVRDFEQRPIGALAVEWSNWRRYVETAPAVRLEGLAFAVGDEGETLVRGAPLPAVPGVRLVDRLGVLVPAGWTWAPAIDPAAVRQAFQLDADDCAYWPSPDRWLRVPADAWSRVSRSAVRAVAREVEA